MNSHLAKPPARRCRGFTFVELMTSLIIFSMVASAGTYLVAASSNTQQYVQGGAAADSEVEFAIQRITENIRAATAPTSYSASSLTITSPPTLISGTSYTFTITYSMLGSNLIESYVNNANNQTYSSGILVHNVSSFNITKPGAAALYQITLNAGATITIQRTFDAFGRNL